MQSEKQLVIIIEKLWTCQQLDNEEYFIYLTAIRGYPEQVANRLIEIVSKIPSK